MGIPLGLVLADNPDRLEVFSYVGTFGAAIAAFWAVFLNQQGQRRQVKREAEAQRPYLLVSKAEYLNGFATITFTNMSQHHVHIQEFETVTDISLRRIGFLVGLLVPRGETVSYQVEEFGLPTDQSGVMVFFFTYASTGPVLHGLLLPFVASQGPNEFASYQTIFFGPLEQDLVSHIEDKNKLIFDIHNAIAKGPQSRF